MARKLLIAFLVFAGMAQAAAAQTLQSPAEFLGYKIGERYTYHYRIAEYFRNVAQASKNVKLQQYGTTTEGRPQLAAFIGTEENIARLDDIRRHNLYLAGLDKSVPQLPNAPVIVWLSYNVHGNEPASSEAAMQTLFDLVNPNNTHTREWLKNTVVVIDPCLNPDGRDRYVNTYTQYGNSTPDANPSAREHTEPWPGGRVSHYYFDLNRDWAWQTQKETQARVGLYNQWLPQIHVDFHEQSYNSPYYFAPAAEPFHKVITSWQREFQTVIGKNNAKYFDENGWMYFTREEFDLLYPSYGDTYPLYNGSIGMTYEQGGISGGLAVLTRGYDTLTLADRVAHHHSNSLSTIETASKYNQKVLEEYKKFFDNSTANPPGDYKAYVIKNDNQDKMNALAKTLQRNGIQYGFGLSRAAKGFNYFTLKSENFNIENKDMVIDAYQPKSVLLSVLLEPKTFVADSNTYDITAWSLPYAYGLKAYGLKAQLRAGNQQLPGAPFATGDNPTSAYAYVAGWQSVEDVKFLSALLKKNIRVRFSEIEFETSGKKYPAGSLIITRAGNKRPDFDKLVSEIARQFNRPLAALTTGFVDKGGDFGSKEVHLLDKPRVMLISNEGTYSGTVGEVWHYFEQQIGYPVTLVRYNDLNRVRLTDFDVMIMPDGSYPDFQVEKLQNWIKDGGKLIAMGDGINPLLEKKGFDIKLKEADKKDDKAAKSKPKEEVKTYGERDHEALKSSVPGAIYKMRLDNTHPLGYGLPNFYYTLKLDDKVYAYLNDGWNVGTIKNDAYVAGFVGQTSKEKIADGMLLGVQQMGRGTVVYLVDDPLFREFWENGKLLFANAVFMVGQ